MGNIFRPSRHNPAAIGGVGLSATLERHAVLTETVVELFWLLGPKKKQVLYYMVSGYRPKEIARMMGRTYRTTAADMSEIRKRARQLAT